MAMHNKNCILHFDPTHIRKYTHIHTTTKTKKCQNFPLPLFFLPSLSLFFFFFHFPSFSSYLSSFSLQAGHDPLNWLHDPLMGHNPFFEKHCPGGRCLSILRIICLNPVYIIPVLLREKGISLPFSFLRGRMKTYFKTTDVDIWFSFRSDITSFMHWN